MIEGLTIGSNVWEKKESLLNFLLWSEKQLVVINKGGGGVINVLVGIMD